MVEVSRKEGEVVAMPRGLPARTGLGEGRRLPKGPPTLFLPSGVANFRAPASEGDRRQPAPGRAVPPPLSGKPWFRLLSAREAEPISAEWSALADRAADDNVFFHPAFAMPAIHSLRADVRLATVRAGDGRLIALALMTEGRLGHMQPAMRSWSHPYAPLGVPLIDPDDVGTAVAGLIDGLAEANRSVILADIPLDGPVAAAVRNYAGHTARPVTVVNAYERAMLDRPPQANADVREMLPTRRRKEFARQMRRLSDLGPVAIESVTEVGQVKQRFDEFLALEAAGWKGRNGTALACDPKTEAFAREAVARAAAGGGARIDSIRVAGKAVASVVGFAAGRTSYTWKIAYDEAFARFSPGAQLMLEAPASFFCEGRVTRLDSCADPGHPMIDHLWRDRLAIGTLVIGPPQGGVRHRLGIALFRREIGARAFARRLKARFRARPHPKEDEE